jgi:hypothetical protein
MREGVSLEALIAALRAPMDSTTGAYLLEGIAKHFSILSPNPSRLVDVVEAMVFFADHQRQTLPGIYDVLSAKTRTLPVNTAVLARANDALSKQGAPEQQATVYDAVFELLTKLDQAQKELEVSRKSGSLKGKEAMRQIERAFSLGDPYTKRFIVWYLGQMASTESQSKESIRTLFGASEPKQWLGQISAPASLRLIAVWAVLRTLRTEPDACQSLRSTLLNQEKDPVILRLSRELPCPPGDLEKEKAP